MEISQMKKEQIEQFQTCDTIEEKMNFLKENDIKLTPEQMERISGGQLEYGSREGHPRGEDVCPANKRTDREHEWEFTGKTRPGDLWGDLWPDYLFKCKYCGKEEWKWTKI